jgi:hypothetical protein
MRITIHARVEGVAGAAAREVESGAIDRADDSDPASGLGLLLREAHVLLAALQDVIMHRPGCTPVQPLYGLG